MLAAAGVLIAVLVAGLAASATAERANVLGKTKRSPNPACAGQEGSCFITGQVTGFQRKADGKANLFKASRNGRIVAWTIDLGRPSKPDREAFGEAGGTDEFGGRPTAGIGVLRKRGRGEYKLLRHSPILKVQSFYGEKPTFTLRDPLRIRKGNIVALTTATWLPTFAVAGQGPNDVWVGSRGKKNCNIDEQGLDYFFRHTRPHRKVGSTRKYKCAYDSARLLYWAHFVPKR